MNKPKILEPQRQENYAAGNLSEIFSEDYSDVYAVRYDKGEYEAKKIRAGNIDQSVFNNIRLIGGETYLTNFTDVVFDSCDFSNMRFSNSSFHRTSFKNCKLTGTVFDKALLSHTTFEACVGRLTAFTDCKFKQVILKNNELISLSFFNCLLKDLQFERNDFSRLELNQTFFRGVDFSACKLDGASFMPEALKGARVSAAQALMLVQMMGIEIE